MNINPCIPHYNSCLYKGGVCKRPDDQPQDNRIITNSSSASFTGAEKLFLTNKNVHKVLEYASNNQAVCLASFALLLGGALRPATIMALPGKGKEDKQYASSHSVASAVIGFTFTSILLSPVSAAVKNMGKEPWNLFCDLDDKTKNFIKYLKQDSGKSIDDIEKEVVQFLNRENTNPHKLITLKDFAKPEYKYLFEEPVDLVAKNKKVIAETEKALEAALKNKDIKSVIKTVQKSLGESSEAFEALVAGLKNNDTLFGMGSIIKNELKNGNEIKVIDSILENKGDKYSRLLEAFEDIVNKLGKFQKKDGKASLDGLIASAKEILQNTKKNLPEVCMSAGKAFRNGNTFGTASKTLNLGIDFLFAIPKAILTIGLIPPILKYVFGVEKPQKGVPQVVQNTSLLQNYAAVNYHVPNTPKFSALETVKGGVE